MIIAYRLNMSREESMLWGDLGFSLLRMYAELLREEKEFAARHQLGPTHLEVLYLLRRLSGNREWLHATVIYPYFSITHPAIGRVLKQLAYWQYIEVKRDEDDRRKLQIRLRGEGIALLEDLERLRAQVLQRYFPGLPFEQLRQWVNNLAPTIFASGEASISVSS
ncbi:MAG: hypothetical protein NZ580_06360 [Bacteroidia bacterium]|nr:hypothetical protein [Bacteroidia bacterium]MDW8235732.1 hypothetical protein [Bacteroidia bacterium]MDW8417610.1 hypothetical protein [Bacteroidia bacterium]